MCYVLCSECKFIVRRGHVRVGNVTYACGHDKISPLKCHPLYGVQRDWVECIHANPACDCPYYVEKPANKGCLDWLFKKED